MTSDIIVIWAGILGLAYLAGAGLCLEMTGGNRRHASANCGFGRHARLQPVKVKHAR